jgi:hypothetical protein
MEHLASERTANKSRVVSSRMEHPASGRNGHLLPALDRRSAARRVECAPASIAGNGKLPGAVLAAMPRYFFHICNGNGFVEDEEGCELPDEAAAHEQAVEGARDVMSGDLRTGELDLTSFIEVEDAGHNLVFTLVFADAVEIKAQQDGGAEARRRRKR